MKSTSQPACCFSNLPFQFLFDVVWSSDDEHLLHDQIIAANLDEALDMAKEMRDPGYFVKNVELTTQPVWVVYVDGPDGLMTTARVRAQTLEEARELVRRDPLYPGRIYKVQRLY